MKFSVGYSFAAGLNFPQMVAKYPQVREVYFAWPDLPSGRAPVDNTQREKLTSDLKELTRQKIKLTLLLNASCWGAEGFSRSLADKLKTVIAQVNNIAPLYAVTAFSPMIADIIKRYFPEIKTRASVNLRIGSIEAMAQSADIFDQYTIQREQNYDLEKLGQISRWANENGKHIQILANSGCCYGCPVQPFHDCMVAHQSESDESDRYANHIPAGCWKFLGQKSNNYRFLAGSWIRPEDMHNYESFNAAIKLATRSHPNPEMVLRSYSRRKFSGNLPDLLEPGHAALFAPIVIDNRRFDDNWFKTRATEKDYFKLDEFFRQMWQKVTLDTSANFNL